MKEIIKAKLPIIIPVACGVIGIVLIAVALTFAWPSLFPAEKDATEPATTESSPISDNVGEASEPTSGGEASEPTNGGEASEPTNGGEASEPTNGGEASEPTSGGEASEPTSGGDVNEPTNGGDVNEPTNGGNDTKPTNGGDVNKPTNGDEASEPEAPPTEPDGPGFVTDENGNDNYAVDIF